MEPAPPAAAPPEPPLRPEDFLEEYLDPQPREDDIHLPIRMPTISDGGVAGSQPAFEIIYGGGGIPEPNPPATGPMVDLNLKDFANIVSPPPRISAPRPDVASRLGPGALDQFKYEGMTHEAPPPQGIPEASLGAVLGEALGNQTGARIEKKIVGTQEFLLDSALQHAHSRLWKATVLPEAAARAGGNSLRMRQDPAVQEAAARAGQGVDDFLMDWRSYAAASPDELQNLIAGQIAKIRELNVAGGALAGRREMADRLAQEGYEALNLRPWSAKDIAFQTGVAAPDVLLTLGTGMAGGAPVGLGAMMGTVAPEFYAQGKSANLPHREAAQFAAGMTALEGLGEAPFAHVALNTPLGKQITKQLIGEQVAKPLAEQTIGDVLANMGKKSLATAGAESIGEGITTVGQDPFEALMTGKELQLGNYLDDILKSMVVGGISGAPFGPVATLQERTQQKQEEVERGELIRALVEGIQGGPAEGLMPRQEGDNRVRIEPTVEAPTHEAELDAGQLNEAGPYRAQEPTHEAEFGAEELRATIPPPAQTGQAPAGQRGVAPASMTPQEPVSPTAQAQPTVPTSPEPPTTPVSPPTAQVPQATPTPAPPAVSGTGEQPVGETPSAAKPPVSQEPVSKPETPPKQPKQPKDRRLSIQKFSGAVRERLAPQRWSLTKDGIELTVEISEDLQDPDGPPTASASLEANQQAQGGKGTATKMFLDALEIAQGSNVGWQAELLSTPAEEKIYQRLKAAGVPFEKDSGNRKGWYISPEALENVDLEAVNRRLHKNAGQPPPVLHVKTVPRGEKKEAGKVVREVTKTLGDDPKHRDALNALQSLADEYDRLRDALPENLNDRWWSWTDDRHIDERLNDALNIELGPTARSEIDNIAKELRQAINQLKKIVSPAPVSQTPVSKPETGPKAQPHQSMSSADTEPLTQAILNFQIRLPEKEGAKGWHHAYEQGQHDLHVAADAMREYEGLRAEVPVQLWDQHAHERIRDAIKELHQLDPNTILGPELQTYAAKLRQEIEHGLKALRATQERLTQQKSKPQQPQTREEAPDLNAPEEAPEEPEESTEEPSSRRKRSVDKTLPSTPREALMKAINMDPAEFRNLGGEEQFAIVKKVLMERYGFKDITKHKSQAWRNAVDHLIDAYEGLHNMAAALQVSPKEMSLQGKLSLNLQRNTKARGLFIHPDNIISIFDQEDVFAHEYGHALDYHLMELAGGITPGGLSRMIRKRENTTALPKTMTEAYADLMMAIYYDGAHIAQLIKKAEHQLEKAKTPQRRAELERRLKNLRDGAWTGHKHKTKFYEGAKKGPLASYLSKPTELLARTFEAYVSWKVQSQNSAGFVNFIGSPDAMYTDKADAWMQRAYPQEVERMAIFNAWDNLIGQMQREQLYDTSKDLKITASEVNMGLIDPVAMARDAGLPLTPEFIKAKNLSDAAARTYLEEQMRNEDTLAKNAKNFWRQLKEAKTGPDFQALMRSLGSTPDAVFAYLEKRHPNNQHLKEIRNLLSDAHIAGRNKPLGLYRETEREETRLTNQLEERLATVGIHANMPQEWADHMWDVLHGYAKPRDQATKIQADQIRYEYERLWKLRDKSGENIGYTSERYMNRILQPGVEGLESFRKALEQLRTQEKEQLLETLREQLAEAQQQDDIERIAKLKAQIKKAEALDPHAMAKDHVARMKGGEWGSPAYLGAASEDSARERVFGPLADKILKDFYIQDPVDLLASYAGAAARGIVSRRRLGDTPNAKLDRLLVDASEDLPAPLVGLLKTAMQVSLGVQIIPTFSGAKIFQAYTNIAMANALGRSAIPNLSEPLGILRRGLDPLKTASQVMLSAVPAAMKTERINERNRIADRLGKLAGILVDSATQSNALARATGDNIQGRDLLSRLSPRAYWFNALTSLTNAQNVMINRMGMEMLYDAAESIRSKDADAALSAQWLREHGVTDTEGFAQWLTGPERLENLSYEDLMDGHGLTLANAAAHLVHTTIQKPTPSTKHMMANRGLIGIVFRLTAWMTTNERNYRAPLWTQVKAAATGKYGSVKLTPKQRATAMAIPALQSVVMLYASQALFTLARLMLTHPEEWDERKEQGGGGFWSVFLHPKTQIQILQSWGLLGWLGNTLLDTSIGARFHRGVFQTLAGASYGALAQDATRILSYSIAQFLRPFGGEGPSYAQRRDMARVGVHLATLLGTFSLLNIIPAKHWASRAGGFLWSFFGTSPRFEDWLSKKIAGPKPTKIEKKIQSVNRGLKGNLMSPTVGYDED